ALLDVRHSQVQYCFEQLRPGLAQELRASLHRQLAQMPPEEVKPFEPFTWEKHQVVRRAWELASADVLSELHLLLALLDGTSNTITWLPSLLGPNGKDKLRHIANRMLSDGPNIPPTPGFPPCPD